MKYKSCLKPYPASNVLLKTHVLDKDENYPPIDGTTNMRTTMYYPPISRKRFAARQPGSCLVAFNACNDFTLFHFISHRHPKEKITFILASKLGFLV